MPKRTTAKRIRNHIRNRLISGLLVLVPLWITILVVRMLFGVMAGVLGPVTQAAFAAMPDSALKRAIVFLISVAVFVCLVYAAGAVTAFVVGRKMVATGESVILRIPFVKSVYSAAKQVVDAFAISNKSTFKSVVLVEFPRPGLQAVGFVTGTVKNQDGAEFYKVFIPTAPNPTTGFLEIVPPADVRQTDLTVEEGFKMLVSGGLISPDCIGSRPASV